MGGNWWSCISLYKEYNSCSHGGFHGGLPYIIDATHPALVSFPPWTFKGRHPYEASWCIRKGWALCKAQSINIRLPKAWYERLTTFLIPLGFTVAVFFTQMYFFPRSISFSLLSMWMVSLYLDLQEVTGMHSTTHRSRRSQHSN